jgi:thymidylate synthase (FAD)
MNMLHISLGTSVKFYDELIKGGVSRELARAVLPQATYTTFYMTGNLHNWVKFLKLRNDEHSQPETRDAAHAIEEMLLELFPVTMQSLFDGDKS